MWGSDFKTCFVVACETRTLFNVASYILHTWWYTAAIQVQTPQISYQTLHTVHCFNGHYFHQTWNRIEPEMVQAPTEYRYIALNLLSSCKCKCKCKWSSLIIEPVFNAQCLSKCNHGNLVYKRLIGGDLISWLAASPDIKLLTYVLCTLNNVIALIVAVEAYNCLSWENILTSTLRSSYTVLLNLLFFEPAATFYLDEGAPIKLTARNMLSIRTCRLQLCNWCIQWTEN